jgi:hypothetical protein
MNTENPLAYVQGAMTLTKFIGIVCIPLCLVSWIFPGIRGGIIDIFVLFIVTCAFIGIIAVWSHHASKARRM